MSRLFPLLIALCTVVAASAAEPPAATPPAGRPLFSYTATPPAPQRLDLASQEMAGKVYFFLKDQGLADQRIAVLSAVPLADLKHETEFGRLWGEYLLTDLADRGLRVRELRLGKEIAIRPQGGEFLLSRNAGELAATSVPVDFVLVSTYANTRNDLILQARLVALANGESRCAWRQIIPLDRDLVALFRSTPAQPPTIAIRAFQP